MSKNEYEAKVRGLNRYINKKFGPETYQREFEPRDYEARGLSHQFEDRYNHLHFIKGFDRHTNRVNCIAQTTFTKTEKNRNFFNLNLFMHLFDKDIEGAAKPCNILFAVHKTLNGGYTSFAIPVFDIPCAWGTGAAGIGTYENPESRIRDSIWIAHDHYESWHKDKFS